MPQNANALCRTCEAMTFAFSSGAIVKLRHGDRCWHVPFDAVTTKRMQ